MSSLVGQNISGYSVLSPVGSGGMGTVYRGIHNRLGRTVAIKTLHVGTPDGKEAERFLAEAQLQGALRHPGIATLYDFLEQDGHAFIIMEFVEGQTLAEYLQSRGPLPVPKALAILRQVSDAVRYLHAQRIVHRDIKPDNIKIAPDGGTKLLDFGIARSLRSSQSGTAATSPGLLVGTFEYLAPECFEGKGGDERSDVWSLGVLLYEMLTGRLPFEGHSTAELCRRIGKGSFTPASKFNRQISPSAEKLLARCLEKNGPDRFSSIDALEGEISALLKGNLLKSNFIRSRDALLRPLSIKTRQLLIFGSAIVVLLGLAFAYRIVSPTDNSAPAAEVKAVNIDAVNGPAEVFSDGHDLGVTPLKIEKPAGQHVSLLLKRDGFADLPVEFDVDERSSYSYVLREQKQ